MAIEAEAAMLEYSDDPAVLVFADRAAAREASADAVRAAGGRVSAALPLGEALERLRAQAVHGTVVIELDEDGGPELDRLLEGLDEDARSGRHIGVVILPARLIDIVTARTGAGDVTLLCDPAPFERLATIAAALARRTHRLSDVNAEGSGARLKELSEEVGRIARVLAHIAAEDASRPPGLAPLPPGEPGSWPVDSALIRALIRVRRMRGQFFTAELFADPAWDMLLDLTAARLEGRAVAVSSLCIAAAVPPTTALRWIKTLTDAKLFARVADSTDGRRVFIELTDQAADGMIGYLSALQRVLSIRS